ncbi:MAG: hypothetical protein Q9184_008080 [Pyrenodesmia sp. 2 TL-2023]
MQRNVPLRSEWEAEENYNFHDFHRPGCKEKEIEGECGCEGQTGEQLTSERQLRMRERPAPKAGPEKQKSLETMTARMEEPGDEDFVIETSAKATPTKATPATLSLGLTPHDSCFRCAFRSMVCDGRMPCSACVKGKAKCAYNPSTPTKGSPTTRTPTNGTLTKGSQTKRTPSNGSPSASYCDLMEIAAPLGAPSPSLLSSLGKSSYATCSCMPCAGRRIKCDRQLPCSACVERKVDCFYNPLTPSKGTTIKCMPTEKGSPAKRIRRAKATPKKSVKFAE